MKNVWRYSAIGVAAYFLILLATYPATRLVSFLEQQVDGLGLRAITGSVISGHAGQLLWQGDDLGAVDWQLQPLRLLLGAAEYRLDMQNAQASGSTRLGITLLGTVYGRELDMILVPESIINQFSPVPVSAGGELTLRFDHYVPAGRVPSGVQGALVWHDAVIREPVEIPLGDLELSLGSVDDALVATLINGGTLGASGEITLSGKGRYAVDVVLKPGTDVNSDVLDLLEVAARKQPGGKYRLNTSGSL